MQSLGFDMRVLDEDDQEVELRDLDEGMWTKMSSTMTQKPKEKAAIRG